MSKIYKNTRKMFLFRYVGFPRFDITIHAMEYKIAKKEFFLKKEPESGFWDVFRKDVNNKRRVRIDNFEIKP